MSEKQAFTANDYVPMAFWGKDHWSTLAYLETVMVDCGGFQVGFDGRMRANRRNYRVMLEECPRPTRPGKPVSAAMVHPMDLKYSTVLNDKQVIEGHDDWSCVQDMAQEGLFNQHVDEVEPGNTLTLSEKGTQLVNLLREHKRNKGQFAHFRGFEPAVAPEPVAA